MHAGADPGLDCGPDGICHTADDVVLLQKVPATYSNGNFTIVLVTPLVPGQKIYVTDGCNDPALSLPAIVGYPTEAPLMSPVIILMLVATLGIVGLLGLNTVRRR